MLVRRGWVSRIDRWAFNRVARTDSVFLDRVLPKAGRAANYGMLWVGISVALAATRNRQARRAALRGLAALGVSSTVANLVTKSLFGRVRPSVELIPLVRQLTRAPVTTSFPSGHSASAAAFATGVAIEAPALAVPVGMVASAVAASRVVTGAHYPSDVLAGVTLGAAAGALTLWWWPKSSPGPAEAAAPEDTPPATATGEGVVVVVNSDAGSAHEGLSHELAELLPDAEVRTVEPGDDLVKMLRAAAERGQVLGVAGGDGTINAAARAAAERDVPLLVIPGGTLNRFAHDLGVHSVHDAVTALRTGSAVLVDLGSAGDAAFLNTCSTGLYVDMVRYREKWEQRLGKWPAMLLGLVHALRAGEPRDLVVNGHRRRLWMLFAGNGRYLPKGFAPMYRPRLDDGYLDVRLVDGAHRFARTRIVLSVLTGTLRWCPVYQAGAAQRVRISAPTGELGLSVDGEITVVPADIVLRKQHRRLVVYRPSTVSGQAGPGGDIGTGVDVSWGPGG